MIRTRVSSTVGVGKQDFNSTKTAGRRIVEESRLRAVAEQVIRKRLLLQKLRDASNVYGLGMDAPVLGCSRM